MDSLNVGFRHGHFGNKAKSKLVFVNFSLKELSARKREPEVLSRKEIAILSKFLLGPIKKLTFTLTLYGAVGNLRQNPKLNKLKIKINFRK